MRAYRPVQGIRKFAALGLMGTMMALPLGACNLEDFSTTTTTTLSGREVVSFLVRSALLTPIENFIDGRIADFFGDDEEA